MRSIWSAPGTRRTLLQGLAENGFGHEQLDQEKLTPLLRLRYGAIQDAVADLGHPEEINRMFTGFQKYLYVRAA